MAIPDEQLQFSDAQLITGTDTSTNYIDVSPLYGANTGRDVGNGAPLYILVNVTQVLAPGGVSVIVTLEHDSVVGFGGATTAQTIGTLAPLSPAGTQLIAAIDPGALTKQYCRLKYTESGGSLDSAKLTAYIIDEPALQTYYASGSTIKG